MKDMSLVLNGFRMQQSVDTKHKNIAIATDQLYTNNRQTHSSWWSEQWISLAFAGN